MAEKKVVKKVVTETTEAVAKAPAKVAAPKEKKVRKIGLRKWKDEQVIILLMDHNPKRPGTTGHSHFEQYEDGMTVADALKAGITGPDLSWDSKHNFIMIADEFDDTAEKKSKVVKEKKPKAEKEPAAATPAKKKKAAPVVEEEEEEEEEE